ncbi:MAG: hypothetical protein WCL53_07035 [Chloroflexota bacterium]
MTTETSNCSTCAPNPMHLATTELGGELPGMTSAGSMFPNPYSVVYFYECDECHTKWGWRVRRAGGFSNGGAWDVIPDADDEDPPNPNLAPHSN